MSVEENLRVDREAIAAFNARDWDLFDELHAESVIVYSSGNPEPSKGRAAHREEAQAYVTAFPDIQFEEERSFGQGEWVCDVYVATGTHTGPLEGPGGQALPATNKPLRLEFCGVTKFEGGKIAEEHNYFDLLGMMAQLGLAP
ncbi:MAG: ester cyclase [Thermoplasmata archaeon]